MEFEKKNLFNIRYCRLHFFLRMEEDCKLPVNKPSAIRGGIGEMLLRANCIRDRKCDNCDFYRECIVQRTMYSQFDVKPSFLQERDSIGYIIECENYEEEFHEGDILRFTLVLFGKTCVYFNQYLQAVFALGCNGLGKAGAHFSIDCIKNTRNEDIINGSNVLMEYYRVENLTDYVNYRLKKLADIEPKEIIFQTPLTQKYENEFLKEFNMEVIVRSIKRRLFIFDCFENNCIEEAESFYMAEESEIPVIVSQEVRPFSVRRYSSRQNAGMNLNGIKGRIVLDKIPEKLLPLLVAGEVMHIGKNTSFGFGRYVVK